MSQSNIFWSYRLIAIRQFNARTKEIPWPVTNDRMLLSMLGKIYKDNKNKKNTWKC